MLRQTLAFIPTNCSCNFNPDTKEWEVVKAMPEGMDDVVLFSSPSKAAADNALRDEIEKEYPGLLAQHGGVIR
jgi:hypothetical protein